MSTNKHEHDRKLLLGNKTYIDWTERLKSNGKYYGYPECCIGEFIDKCRYKKNLTVSQDIVNKGYGFIPCPQCADRVRNGEISLEGLINTSRQCPCKFPKQK